jgi:hypothetical protein
MHTEGLLVMKFTRSCLPIYLLYSELLSTVTNVVLWDVSSCGSCENRRFGVTYHLHFQIENNHARTRATVANYC